MRKIVETEYQMGEREFKNKLGLEGDLITMIITKTNASDNKKVITIKMKRLTVE